MLKIGITGGIGSGKTVVCKIFEQLGIYIYYADDRARFLINSNSRIQQEIIKVFGAESFTSDGYNSKYIARLVFANSDLLSKLNEIMLGKISADFDSWCDNHNNQKYIIQESAILVQGKESGSLDKIIVVDAPFQLKIDRVKKRNDLSDQEIINRMEKQLSPEQYKSMADWIILNDNDHLIIPQILNIHNQILKRVLNE